MCSSVPSMQYWRSFWQASPRIRAECSTLLMMTGRMALSSKLPWLPAKATQLSSARTWMQTMTMASHWVGLTLPGMIEEPGCVGREDEFADAAARARAQPADVVGDLGSADTAIVLSPAWAATMASLAALGFEVIGGFGERPPVSSAIRRRDSCRECRVGVDAGADGGAADGQFVQAERRVDSEPVQGLVQLCGVAGELLADADGRGVHRDGCGRS